MTAPPTRYLPRGFLLFLLSTLGVPSAASAADLAVTVLGVRAASGILRLAMFSDPAQFPSGEKDFARNVPAVTGDMRIELTGLPPGTYALALHHDENGNDGMDTNFLGVPLEGYGFSNDAPVFLGPPSFSAAAFEIPLQGREIAVRVRY